MIASCKLEKNWESGLAAWNCGDLNLRELRIVENLGSGVWFNSTRGIFMICSFERNKGFAGGGLSLVDSDIFLPMRQCSFEGNSAEGATGGAINADSSQALIAECVFRDNSAQVAGGAIAVMNESKVSISRSRFSGNHAKTSGAIHGDRSDINVAFSIFDRNRSIALGAAVGFVGRAKANINPIVGNNTFYKNSSEPGQEGATIFCERVSPEIRRNIIVIEGDQKAVSGIQTSPLYQCNLLFDPTGVGLKSLPSTETLVGDPLFCDPEHDDFFLRDLSPAALATCGPIGPLPKRCTSFKMVPSR
jgi:predicted outer membrane repeat protein